MDPNETLRRIDSFLTRRQTGEEVDYWTQDLYDWIQRGGFEPDWNAYPLGESYFRTRSVVHAKGQRVEEGF